MINGKATLVRDIYCDGLGACLGDCPTGALTIEQRPADEFNEIAVAERLIKIIRAAKEPSQQTQSQECPGQMVRLQPSLEQTAAPAACPNGSVQAIRSELSHWPVQLRLVNPEAPFFAKRDLVLMAPCSPVASADLHWRFIRRRAVVLACPKLDQTSGYAEKLAAIIRNWQTPKLIVVRMEVPCCAGLTRLAREAIMASAPKTTALKEVIIGRNGDIKEEQI